MHAYMRKHGDQIRALRIYYSSVQPGNISLNLNVTPCNQGSNGAYFLIHYYYLSTTGDKTVILYMQPATLILSFSRQGLIDRLKMAGHMGVTKNKGTTALRRHQQQQQQQRNGQRFFFFCVRRRVFFSWMEFFGNHQLAGYSHRSQNHC